MTAAREFQPTGDGGYILAVPSLGVGLQVDRLRRERHELIGELAVVCNGKLPTARTIDGCLSLAAFNLSSATARVARAKILADRSDAPDLDWATLLEELCIRVIAAEREGAPAKPLHTLTRVAPTANVDIHGWPWLRDHPMMTFGDGGSLKSYLALWGAGVLSQAGLAVGYCDWELSGEDHHERLARLFPDAMPLIQYLRCDRPLVHEVDRITREVRRLGLDLYSAKTHAATSSRR